MSPKPMWQEAVIVSPSAIRKRPLRMARCGAPSAVYSRRRSVCSQVHRWSGYASAEIVAVQAGPGHAPDCCSGCSGLHDTASTSRQRERLVAASAAGGLAYTARTYRLSREGHFTDRYSKAVEQLGD